MAAFFTLEAAAWANGKVISSKSADLNKKLGTINNDIAAKISPQFMAQVQCYSPDKKILNITGFRTWTELARKFYNAPEIQKIYNALDKLNLSAKTTADTQKYMWVIKNLGLPGSLLKFAQVITVIIMVKKLNIARTQVRKAAENLDPDSTRNTWEIKETEPSAFKIIDTWGKFATSIIIVVSVINIFLNIYNIINVIDQSKTIYDKLSGPIK
ncbi:uncharacterized protein K444DRAFT_632836 [Hyaloscypha bicolor E]|uniref:Uncharacterized protein n=1 Tax=Hyaloscypha bicolor E TaxID=1095630 RepID=A0A2J6T0B2_9HELO|nr:uncharacterized protein K444DRAFT_632836 [Hyaloscypha bicolor E]PMD56429.1 hypothetical protein K444DRAFT_632836 [Hyaloscypha bicolor E]